MVTLDADIKVAAGKEEHEDLHLDLLLYKSTRQGAGPLSSPSPEGHQRRGAGGAAEEEGVALKIAQENCSKGKVRVNTSR